MADHNDPNAINSIFSDVQADPADVYDMFGFPSPDTDGGEKVVIALTFASRPETGIFDTDLLYRLRIFSTPRAPARKGAFPSFKSTLFNGLRYRYPGPSKAVDIRVSVDESQRATVEFRGFNGGDFSRTVDTNRSENITTPSGHTVKTFVGGRDDAFFNDLTGFFRSINYAPQFYDVPRAKKDAHELNIPKTLLELEGNDLFNHDSSDDPHWGYGHKKKLPPGPWDWKGDRYRKDENGNFRFVYSGRDCQAGINVNCVVLEIPLAFITQTPADSRVVNVWGESWVRKGVGKADAIPDNPSLLKRPLQILTARKGGEGLKPYKLVDTVGQPFADAALSEREDALQVGALNFFSGLRFVRRLAHLGWGFGPSIGALGLKSSFDYDDLPVSIHKKYSMLGTLAAFKRTQKTLFQELRMPDQSWNPKGLDIPLRRVYEIFVPNVCAIDMDTTGTWPYGRRLEDQVATSFLTLFLDMDAEVGSKKYHLHMLNDQALWDQVPIEPKTPPNPLTNDKDFLVEFPYLAAPWPPRPMEDH